MRILKFLLFFVIANLNANELQNAIDSANAGDIITLNSGEYHGNIVISKPLTLDGVNQSAIIVGDNKGSVINVKSPNVVIKNLTIKGSGTDHSNDDSGIKVSDAYNVSIENNDIKDVLFGVTFLKTSRSKIIQNNITSRGLQMGFRGDGIKLWYSHENEILSNRVINSRDMVFWYSSTNHIAKNYGKGCRYSLHFMYSNNSLVEDNTFENNMVGLFFMFSHDSVIKNNVVRNADGVYGVGIGMKDSSNFTITDNKLIYNARGFYLDQSPYQPNTVNKFSHNKVAYNSVAVQFHATQEKSIFERNSFKGNIEIALNDTPESKLLNNEWRENFYDNYDGFDMDNDGYGDSAYISYAYADEIWQHRPNVRFFYGSGAMMMLNFIAKLAPFSQPTLLLKDEKPRIKE